MKSWISKALLGLFIAAPSVMARLPSTNGTVGGIYLKSKGMTTSETRMLQNSLGLWLSGMVWDLQPGRSMYRYQAYPDGAAATITVEKIDGISPQVTDPFNICIYSQADGIKCHYDITRTKNAASEDVNLYVKVYTKYTNGTSLFNTPARFQNLMTGIIGEIIHEKSLAHRGFYSQKVVIPNGCHSEILRTYTSSVYSKCEISAGFQRMIQIYKDGKFEMTASGRYASPEAGTWVDTASIPAGATLQHARYILPLASAGQEPGAYSVGLPSRTANGNVPRLAVNDGNGVGVPVKCYWGGFGGTTFGYLFPTEIAPNPTYTPARILQEAGMQVSQVFRIEHSSGTDVLGNTNGTCNTFLGYALDVLNGN